VYFIGIEEDSAYNSLFDRLLEQVLATASFKIASFSYVYIGIGSSVMFSGLEVADKAIILVDH
jgi:hypothetical protein